MRGTESAAISTAHLYATAAGFHPCHLRAQHRRLCQCSRHGLGQRLAAALYPAGALAAETTQRIATQGIQRADGLHRGKTVADIHPLKRLRRPAFAGDHLGQRDVQRKIGCLTPAVHRCQAHLADGGGQQHRRQQRTFASGQRIERTVAPLCGRHQRVAEYQAQTGSAWQRCRRWHDADAHPLCVRMHARIAGAHFDAANLKTQTVANHRLQPTTDTRVGLQYGDARTACLQRMRRSQPGQARADHDHIAGGHRSTHHAGKQRERGHA